MPSANSSAFLQPAGLTHLGSGSLTAYLGHVVSPTSAHAYSDFRDGAVVVDATGKIVAVGLWEHVRGRVSEIGQVVDYGRRLILPGLIDLHLHLPQVCEIGKTGETLLGWLERYIFPAEARFRDVDHARRAANWFFRELARNGTTCAVVFTSVHAAATEAAFKVAASLGNRVIMGKVMMDANCPENLSEDCMLSILQSEELCRRWHGYDGGRLRYAFTPRFALTSSGDLLSGAARLWANYPGTYMHTHLAENEDEVERVLRQFPGSRSYLDVYRRHGMLGENSLFAHAIYLDKKDLAVLSRTSSSVAHCPSSNFFLKSGTFPYERVRAAGVRFGLGSDVAAGPEMSLLRVMKDAAYMQRNLWISACELLYRATLGAAEALNLQDKIGSLTPGKEADFVVVDPARRSAPFSNILGQPTDDLLSSLVYLGDDRMVVSTYVRGRSIYEAEPVNGSALERPEIAPVAGIKHLLNSARRPV
jgi:guanine deaminase